MKNVTIIKKIGHKTCTQEFTTNSICLTFLIKLNKIIN